MKDSKKMAKIIPSSLQAKLWKEKKNQEFDFDEAVRLLKEKDTKTLSVVLSDLRKHRWLETRLDSGDARKRTHRLKFPQDVVEEIGG